MIHHSKFFSSVLTASVLAFSLAFPQECEAKQKKKKHQSAPQTISAKAAIVLDAKNGKVLYSKNANLRLLPASTTKVITTIVAFKHLPLWRRIRVSKNAAAAPSSKAGLTAGAEYSARDLIFACLIASSNDAAIALAEAVAGSEKEFTELMNAEAKRMGMTDTRFMNATGLTPDSGPKPFTTAKDLAILMRCASRDKRIDQIMGMMSCTIKGSDGRVIALKNHNKMLWKTPKFVKGKTGWTFASRHTFVGTNYGSQKLITFAMLSSTEPWTDIERLATIGLSLRRRA